MSSPRPPRRKYVNRETSHLNRRRFPDGNNKAQIAAELAYKFAELGPVLVFCSQPNYAKAVAKALQEQLRLLSLVGENIPPYFEGAAGSRSALLANEWLGDRSMVSLLRSGIGVHYGYLVSMLLRRLNCASAPCSQRK
jgi:hypothetical protein